MGVISFTVTINVAEEQSEQIMGSLLDQTGDNLTYRLNEILTISNLLYPNETLIDVLERAHRGYGDLAREYDDYKRLYSLVTQFENNDSIYRIRLFLTGDNLLSREGNNLFSLEEFVDKALYKRILAKPLFWTPTVEQSYLYRERESVFTLYRAIRSKEDFHRILGILALDVREGFFSEILSHMIPYDKGAAFLYLEGGLISLGISENFDRTVLTALRDAMEEADWERDVHVDKLDRDSYLFLLSRREIASGRWGIGITVDQREAAGASRTICYVSLILTGVSLLLSFLFALVFSSGITDPLKTLEESLEGIHRGEYRPIREIQGHDEIALLQHRYNELLSKIEELIERDYKTQISLKAEELKALEGQINSHFLYNMLDTARWMAVRNNSHDLGNMLDAFSRFFRLSLNRGGELTTVKNEVNHVEIYLYLQNIRFNGSLKLINRLDKSVYENSILRLILQPLAENCIAHGFHRWDARKGTIILSNRWEEGHLVLTMEDDGVGLGGVDPVEILESSEKGYGLFNVNQRLKLYFGETSGLRIGENCRGGVNVDILLPVGSVSLGLSR